MSTGRPPIALSLIDDDHQSRCVTLQRRLTPQQALAFERFLSFRSLHLLTWLYRCFPSLEGQLQRGALPAIMRCDPVIKLSASSINRGVLFDKRRLWVCTDTHLFVFREDGALKVQVAIADVAEVVHIRVAVPVPTTAPSALAKGSLINPPPRRVLGLVSMTNEESGDEEEGGVTSGGDDETRKEDNLSSTQNNFDEQVTGNMNGEVLASSRFVAHRTTAVCHALVLRCPNKRDVGAFFGPSSVAANLVLQYIINRRRVAIVNYAVRSGSTSLPPAAAVEAIVSRPHTTMSPTQLISYLSSRGVFLKRPPGTATAVTLSAPAVPLITASATAGSAAAVELAIGNTVYQEALREVESNAARCREETADAMCGVLIASHLEYSAVARKALVTQHKTDLVARKLAKLHNENNARYKAATDMLLETRAEVQKIAVEMLSMNADHSKNVEDVRGTCLTSEDRSKQTLSEASEDDHRAGATMQQLTNEAAYLEEQIEAARRKLCSLSSSLPSASALEEEVDELKYALDEARRRREASEAGLRRFIEDTEARTGLALSTRSTSQSRARTTTKGISSSLLLLTNSKEKDAENADDEIGNVSEEEPSQRGRSHSVAASASSPFAEAHEQDILLLEGLALKALSKKREAYDFLAKARISHGNECIMLERKKERCEQLADQITEAVKSEKVANEKATNLRRDIDLLKRRIRHLPTESLLCEDLRRAQVIEASVERSVRAGASPAGLMSGEAVLNAQLAHLQSIRDRMRNAVEKASCASAASFTTPPTQNSSFCSSTHTY